MSEPEQHSSATAEGGRRLRPRLVVAGAALGLGLAGLGVAAAQTDSPPPTATAPAQRDAGFRFKGGHHGPGIHGEFTTRAPGGGYQTVGSQVGEVTEVSASSLTVKSEDGFSRTYSVDDNTLVNAGNQGISDVKTGDQVRVAAIVKDGRASAVSVADTTQIGRLRGRWMPERKDRSRPPERTAS